MIISTIVVAGAATLFAQHLLDLPKKKIVRVRKKRQSRSKKNYVSINDRYQNFVAAKIDPLFSSQQRNQQLSSVVGYAVPSTSLREARVNVRIALCLGSFVSAVVGAIAVPVFSILSGVALAVMFCPWIVETIQKAIQERRATYISVIGVGGAVASLVGGYFVVTSASFLFLLVITKLSLRTEHNVLQSMREHFGLHVPKTVWVLIDGAELEIPFEQLRTGQVLRLGGGQILPIDGRVVAGEAAIDQHTLTGESRLAEKTAGDDVFANTMIVRGRIDVLVTKTGAETTAAQITSLLSNAANTQLDVASRSEKSADRLVGPVAAASALAYATVGFDGATAVLNSSFGGNMLLVGPLSMLTYLSIASRDGVLVKDGRSLERLAAVDVFVFDKTGTLTGDEPDVAAVRAIGGFSQDDVLRFAAIAEHRQTHPIAKAILAAAGRRGLVCAAPEDASYTIGMGVQVTAGAHTVHVGSARFILNMGIALGGPINAWMDDLAQRGGSLVFVAVDHVCIGALELAARIRPEAAALTKQLARRGLQTYILSGDARDPTAALARELGVGRFLFRGYARTKSIENQGTPGARSQGLFCR